jgi:hypothetical protein
VIEADGDSRLIFRKSPFALKGEIKAMAGSRWNPERKCWSVANNARNMFQLRHMMKEPTDENPYAWFERPLEPLADPVTRPLKDHQIEMIQKFLTYRYQLFAADAGLGKSLTAIEIWERLASQYGWDADAVREKVWFIGPKSALESVELDIYKWKVALKPTLMTYERFVIDSEGSDTTPQLIFFDECSGLKTPGTLRVRTAQRVTDDIRSKYGTDGGVLLMSGTVTAKLPSDIWAQAEITWPGFLREGSLQAFQNRYAVMERGEDADGNTFSKIADWKDDEVARIPARLEGLMSIYRKSDYLSLPPRTFHRVTCEPTARMKRIAKAILEAAPNVISGLTALRALSSGFQYDEGPDNDNGERAMVETKCPKDDELVKILKEDETRGRTIVFAAFQGSIDRVKRICQAEGWDIVQIDGRGWNCYRCDGEPVQDHILDFWANNPRKTVLVGNPASCRFGLTLIEATTVTYFDSSFSAEHRLQSMDRIYRIGQTEPVRVIDLLHLPVDHLVLDTLMENRRLEELSLGSLLEVLDE